MTESIASLRRVSMTGSITWNSKKQGVYDLLKKNQMEAVIVDYWKRIPKESFQNWYKSQSRYRTKEASSVACWVYVQICETENSGRNAARIARSRPVYHCHGYLVRKTDGGIIEAMIE